MPFTKIFLDLYQQELNSGHILAARFTLLMTEILLRSKPDQIWLLSIAQPEPTCLANFGKLSGKPLGANHTTDYNHSTTVLQSDSHR